MSAPIPMQAAPTGPPTAVSTAVTPPRPPHPAWRPTSALVRAAVLSVSTLGLALALGRADLAAIGAPIALALVLAQSARAPDQRYAPSALAGTIEEPRPGRIVHIDIEVLGTDACQLVTVRTPDPYRGAAAGFVTGRAGQAVVATTRVPDWGTYALARPDVTAAGPDALWQAGPIPSPELVATVAPEAGRMDPLRLPPVFGGWAGGHTSRRPGSGGDLIDVREYAPGDRLRSIHWRASARHQKLFVRRTQSDADVEFVLCVDTRTEIRPQHRPPRSGWVRLTRRCAGRLAVLGRFLAGMVTVPQPIEDPVAPVDATQVRAGPSSLDLSVAAAAAIARAQLRAGDRVGLLDLSTYRRAVRMGTGTRHLDRIRHQLGELDFSDWPWLVRAELWGIPPAAVVVLVTPLADASVLAAASDCQARGHQVIVIDVLPVLGLQRIAKESRIERSELRLLLADRRLRIGALQQQGIPVVHWENGDPATALALFRRAIRQRR